MTYLAEIRMELQACLKTDGRPDLCDRELVGQESQLKHLDLRHLRCADVVVDSSKWNAILALSRSGGVGPDMA